MKFPICRKCLKSELLCDECAKIVGERSIKANEIRTFRALNKLSRKYEPLKDAKVDRVVDSSNMVLIITDRENASKIIGKNGGMVKKLSEDLGKRIRVVSDLSTVGDFVKEIFYSNHIIGINVVYGDGEKHMVKLSASEKDNLPIDLEKFSKVVNSLFGVDAELVFE